MGTLFFNSLINNPTYKCSPAGVSLLSSGSDGSSVGRCYPNQAEFKVQEHLERFSETRETRAQRERCRKMPRTVMSVPNTPSKRLTLHTTTTPTTSRIAAASSTIHSSPHYQTTRRHSLYGTEDRIVIDPGSHIWKVGFSGEGRPRDVFFGDGQGGLPLWGLFRAKDQLGREEEDRVLQSKLQERLRAVFHECAPADISNSASC